MTREERFAKMRQVDGYTSNKIEEKLKEIMSLKERMTDLVDTVYEARKNGLCVNSYLSHNEYQSIMYIRDGALFFKNEDYSGRTDDKYYIVALNGNVYRSDYSSKILDGRLIPSDTFKITPCRPTQWSHPDEELRQKYLYRITRIVETFVLMEQRIYADIDNQIAKKGA